MPAIDPLRLARQVVDLQSLAADPAELTRAVTRLTGEYLVRARREPAPEASLPPPVHRAILHGLQVTLGTDPEAGARAAAALWGATPVAAKLVAAGLIGSYSDDFAAGLVEAWASEAVPARVIQQLAEVGLTGWRRAHPGEFLRRAAGWLGDRRRLLALYALRAAVQEADFEDLPAVFALLDGVGGRLRGESKRAFGLLIKALASRSEVETAQFLAEQMERGGAGTAWMKTLLSDRPFRSSR